MATPAAHAVVNPPKLAPVARDTGLRCNGEGTNPVRLPVRVGKSTMFRLQEPVAQRSVGDPDVLQALLVAPDTLYLVGVETGSTNMIIQGRSGACTLVDVTVSVDPDALQALLASAFPQETELRVLAAADSLVLSGIVSDATVASRAHELASAYVAKPPRPTTQRGDEAVGGPNVLGTNNLHSRMAGKVINLLAVRAPQQVMLEVKVAEVSKTLLERLEIGHAWQFTPGSWAVTLLSNFLSGTVPTALDARRQDGSRVTAAAREQNGLVKLLAEPNVMAISGQEGSFLAGGRFFIPVSQDNNKVTLEEKEFGVGVRFTPTVLANGTINLRVAPEVSELSREGIGITAAGFSGTAVLPVVTTRRASTTVQLQDGQSFAIGGLIRNKFNTGVQGLPGLADLPVLGALFRSTDFQQDRSELVFVVTVRLVKPLPAGAPLPTDGVDAPGRAELMLGGRLQSKPKATPVTPVSGGAAAAPGSPLPSSVPASSTVGDSAGTASETASQATPAGATPSAVTR
jgi:pilus assembly protein CpaC